MIALLGLSLGIVILGISMIVFGYQIQAAKAQEAAHRAFKAEMELREYMNRHDAAVYTEAELKRRPASERQRRAVNLEENDES